VTVSVASLKERFPEIVPVDDTVVTRAIGEATRRTSRAALGDRYDDAVTLRAAHLVACSPQGGTARLEGAVPGKLESTTYGSELLQLFREACGGPHMGGVGPLG